MSEIETIECPLCHFENAQSQWYGRLEGHYIICPRCGEYSISRDFEIFRDVKETLEENAFLLSGYARELHEKGLTAPSFTIESIPTLLNSPLIPDKQDLTERAKKFLTRVRERTQFFSQPVPFKTRVDYPLAYAQNDQEFRAMITLLERKRYVGVQDGPDTRVVVTILEDGWEFSSPNPKLNAESNQGFVAAWFDDSTNDYIDATISTIRSAGFKPVCIRDEKFPERIMDKALGEMRKSKFVVADLTGNRSSVFFEAGFAEALGLEVFYLHKGEVPKDFYARHYQCYIYKDTDELKEMLGDAIAARLNKPRTK